MWIDYVISRALDTPAITGILQGDDEVAVNENAWAIFLLELAKVLPTKKIVAVLPTEKLADQIYYDLEILAGRSCETSELVPWETLPFERISPSASVMGKRLKALEMALSGKFNNGPKIVVSSLKAVSQKLPGDIKDAKQLTIKLGDQMDPQQVIHYLVDSGYTRVVQVEAHGEFAVKGGILDIFIPNYEMGVRLDFYGDQVESVRLFDIDDQRSKQNVGQIEIVGCREFKITDAVKAKALELKAVYPKLFETLDKIIDGQYFSGFESWLPILCQECVLFDLLGEDSVVLYFDYEGCKNRSNLMIEEEKDIIESLGETWDLTMDAPLSLRAEFERLNLKCQSRIIKIYPFAPNHIIESFDARPINFSESIFEAIYDQIRNLLDKNFKVGIFATSEFSRDRITANLNAQNAKAVSVHEVSDFGDDISVVAANLEKSVIIDSQKLALISEFEITKKRTIHRPIRHRKKISTGFFDEMAVGSYVVHEIHGIARFAGMVKRSIDDVQRDYLLLEYKGNDRLYLPVEMMDYITPYSGGESPPLSKLGGADWAKTTGKVRAEIAKVAVELVELYKARTIATGIAFSVSDALLEEFVANTFSYVETADQKRAIEEVFMDMETSKPMDRLICGDVGFGKTEVAIRAIFKALNDSKQVAFLAPTTILANQHYKTLLDRFKSYPFRVELLSRFLTAKESESVIKDLKSGTIDVVVGTHKLLSEKINFKDLGLLVVDEEQKFGVSHKEKLKKLQVGVDVLTLSASPIPRTLEMSLTGIKEMSLITTPPVARQPILTFVGSYDQRAVSEAIRRELLREGQVFYVFNRVRGIQNKVLELQELVPQAKIGFAHGQMDENQLEQTILDFIDNKFDVLVCTTIIESGIDMPNVNTLIVERADLLGLGQMHQLRGRVGRSNRKAYAYLFYPQNRKLGDTAYERLKSISEQTDLGAGFRLAMRDLEIRGAGTLLGNSQSGHIAAVGYDLYVQMVSDAIKSIKGIKEVQKPKVNIDIPIKAYIATSYIEPEDVRLEVYKRLSQMDEVADKEDFQNELKDRFGVMPKECLSLFELVDLKIFCLNKSITEISTKRKPSLYGSPTVELKIAPISLLQSKLIRLTRHKLNYRFEDNELFVDLNNLDAYLSSWIKSDSSLTTDATDSSLALKIVLLLKSVLD